MKLYALLLTAAASTGKAQSTKTPTHLSPAETLRLATRVLSAEGFEVAQSDVAGGLLTLERKASPKDLGEAVKCRWPKNSMASTMGETNFRLSIVAVATDSGTLATVTPKTRTDYSRTMGPFRSTPASDTDCVSTGAMERMLSDSLSVNR